MSAERDAAVRRLRADGASVAEIRAALGLSERQVRWCLLSDEARANEVKKSNERRRARNQGRERQ